MENSCTKTKFHHPEPYFENQSVCFKYFDTDQDGTLNYSEFITLLKALLVNGNKQSYSVDENILKSIWSALTSGKDSIDSTAFDNIWTHWIYKILYPKSALIIVDVQNDFVTGSLALSKSKLGENGAEVIEPINHLISNVPFDNIFFTLDWHPSNHVSFVENIGQRPLHSSSPIKNAVDAKVGDVVIFEGNDYTSGKPFDQILWPSHAVQNTWGSQLHDDLIKPTSSIMILKGTNPDVDSYSAFWDNQKISETNLNAELKARDIQDVYFCGLAYDLCVGQSSLHANEHGYRSMLVEDGCRTFDLDRKKNVKEKLTQGYGLNVQHGDVKDMVEGKDRRVELGLKLALEFEKNTKG